MLGRILNSGFAVKPLPNMFPFRVGRWSEGESSLDSRVGKHGTRRSALRRGGPFHRAAKNLPPALACGRRWA